MESHRAAATRNGPKRVAFAHECSCALALGFCSVGPDLGPSRRARIDQGRAPTRGKSMGRLIFRSTCSGAAPTESCESPYGFELQPRIARTELMGSDSSVLSVKAVVKKKSARRQDACGGKAAGESTTSRRWSRLYRRELSQGVFLPLFFGAFSVDLPAASFTSIRSADIL